MAARERVRATAAGDIGCHARTRANIARRRRPDSVLHMGKLKRIVIVANKGFEADPLVQVLLSERGSPREQDLGDVAWDSYPRLRKKEQRKRANTPPSTTPLIRIAIPRGGAPFASTEEWCIEDMMDPTTHSSNTAEKARVLGGLFSDQSSIDFVIAFGTAATPNPRPFNGSVVVGSQVFVHDPYAKQAKRDGLWTPPRVDEVIEPNVPKNFFRELDEDARYPAEGRFLLPPINPAQPPRIIVGHPFVSVGVVNVNERYDEYAWADPEALSEFQQRTKASCAPGLSKPRTA